MLVFSTLNFPLPLLSKIARNRQINLPQPIQGTLAGEFTLNPDNFTIEGKKIAIASPVIGKFKGEKVTGAFQYQDNSLTLENIQWQQGETLYSFNGWGQFDNQDRGSFIKQPLLQGKIGVERGKIENILESLQFFELADISRGLNQPNYGTSEELYRGNYFPYWPLFSQNLEGLSLNDSLRRFSEIEALQRLQKQKQAEKSLIPELEELTGNFSGTADIEISATEGIQAQFDFLGNSWQWGKYDLDKIILQGNYRQGILTLLPISIAFGKGGLTNLPLEENPNDKGNESTIAFSGSLSPTEQLGQIKLTNIPASLIQNTFKLPDDIQLGGAINLTATLAGSQDNPIAKGEMTVENATINQTAIQSTQGSFNYTGARANFFISSIIAGSPEPLTITGSIPYQLPFALIAPDNDQLNLNLNVKDRGLALLNILSKNQINWIDGKGEINVDITGKIDALTSKPKALKATGITKIEDATIAVEFLPDAPLTQVNGNILFDFDRLLVENLQGNFSGGAISVEGSLPLNKPQRESSPLTFNLNNLAFKLPELYLGKVNGIIRLTGTILEPDIAGELNLADGEVFLNSDKELALKDKQEINKKTGDRTIVENTEFKGLKIHLGKNIRVVQKPILSLVADGTLDVYGTFKNPSPQGTINLRKGQVNLFTSQLSLAKEYPNTARFSTNRPLDPYLNIRLIGSVLETTRKPIAPDALSADVSDIPATNLGGVQTIRIEAKVNGYSSSLDRNLELSSSPTRNETEIIGLLGGNVAESLLTGDTTLGLANLAGNALLGDFNNAITDALGLSEFRLFPTQISEGEKRGKVLGLAAEASLDLTQNFSLSVLKIVNTDLPAQYGIRYRLSDKTILRTTSNFSGDTRAVLEFEDRF